MRFLLYYNMLKFSPYIGLLVFFSILASASKAQQPGLDYKFADRETFRYFVDSKWDSLIFVGNKALRSDIDYFFLRYRLGMAYFSKENYLKSSRHLERSLGFNSMDEPAMELLYYSYLNTNRTLEANTIASKFSSRLGEKLNIHKPKLFEYIYFEPGLTLSNNIEKNEQETFNAQKGKGNGNNQHEVIYGMQDLNDNKYFVTAGAKLNFSRKMSAFVSYGFLATSKLKQIQTSDLIITGDTLIPWNGGYYVGNAYDTISEFYSNKYMLYQNDLYASAQFIAWKGIVVVPAFHYLNIHFNTIFSNNLDSDYFMQEIDTVPVKRIIYEVTERDTAFNNYVASLSFSKYVSLFNLSLQGTWSKLNNKEQYQAGGTVVFYPFGNLNLYTTTSIVSAWQDRVNRFIVEQQAGVKASNKIWVEGLITIGEMQNYNEKNALIVHNTGDKIKFRAGVDFIIILSKNIELSFRYRYTSEEGILIKYYNQSYEETNIDYSNNTITGGIKWKL